ncbi:long-chain fatty acid--CoA ligase [Streptacidiphilus sp. N1-12]|uniref:Long-chain fatty acid--CoA ligase n=2 Tax=Streptacidiphilus alkalitolerans TaxID=3342712 RepID=A0ABV6WSS1_9ACTN
MSFNLATMLRESARSRPEHACCRIGDRTISYAELDELSGRVAANLRATGLVRGDKVAVQLPNVPEFLLAYFGILKAGLVMVPLNPLLKAAEITHQLLDSEARLLITFDACAPEARKAAAGIEDLALCLVTVTAGARAEAGGRDTERESAFESLCTAVPDADARDIVATDADDTAVIIYTSGTTGRPKGAELTHFQLFMNCTTAGAVFGVRADDVSLAVLPFFHVYGLSSVINVGIRYGGTLSLVPRFDIALVVEAMQDHGVSVFVGVPTMFHALLQADTAGRDLSRLRVACSGGAAMPEALMSAFEQRFGVAVLEGYGLSETASTATMNPSPEDRRLLSIGRPIWGVEARIVDGEGRELPPGAGHIGEILLRGHNVMKGYYRNPEATAEAVRDGWLHTGDLAHQDEDGFLFVVDRLKDLIIRGGYNVYPREVEEVLYTHPAVAEAAVIGRPDERLGEEVVGVVSLRDGATATAEEIVDFCRDRLAGYKYPREVRILPELPKNATGKLLKRELRLG